MLVDEATEAGALADDGVVILIVAEAVMEEETGTFVGAVTVVAFLLTYCPRIRLVFEPTMLHVVDSDDSNWFDDDYYCLC